MIHVGITLVILSCWDYSKNVDWLKYIQWLWSTKGNKNMSEKIKQVLFNILTFFITNLGPIDKWFSALIFMLVFDKRVQMSIYDG